MRHATLLIPNFDQLVKRVDILIAQNDRTFTNEAIVAFLGGFSGAFFAFVFDRFAGYISKKRDRYIKHKNAMVRMEYVLVKHQDKISRLTFLLKNTSDILKRGLFTNNRFSGLNIVEEIELELGDIDLINEVANYWLSVERLNSDCESLNRMIETLQTVILSGVKPDQRNFDHLIKQMGTLAQYLEKILLDQDIELTAYLQILMEKDKKTFGLLRFITLYRIFETKVDKSKLEERKKQIYKEIEKRSTEDKKHLDQIG